jgi:hypothetical protein
VQHGTSGVRSGAWRAQSGVRSGAQVQLPVQVQLPLARRSDFAGGGLIGEPMSALVGGVGGVQLRNDKGVTITLQGPKGGLEVSANITKVVITLDQSRSTSS